MFVLFLAACGLFSSSEPVTEPAATPPAVPVEIPRFFVQGPDGVWVTHNEVAMDPLDRWSELDEHIETLIVKPTEVGPVITAAPMGLGDYETHLDHIFDADGSLVSLGEFEGSVGGCELIQERTMVVVDGVVTLVERRITINGWTSTALTDTPAQVPEATRQECEGEYEEAFHLEVPSPSWRHISELPPVVVETFKPR